MKYKRILLKFSGEMLGGTQGAGLDNNALRFFSEEVKSVVDRGIEVGIVIGGGNIFRGGDLIKMGAVDQARGDYMGMLATVINGLALQSTMEGMGIKTKLITAFNIDKVGEMYNHDDVLEYMDEKYVLIFTAGTGNPYFTTDSGAALRAIEIGAEALLKATKVDGVYDDDPMKNPSAKKYTSLTFSQAIEKNLKVLDLTAFALCKEQKMPIIVFNCFEKGNLLNVLENECLGTIVH